MSNEFRPGSTGPACGSAARRRFLTGLLAWPVATLLWTALPRAARADGPAAMPVTFPAPNGRAGAGVLALPEAAKAPGLVILHEWWGLNDEVKAAADELARDGFLVLAPDLFGRTTADADEARALVAGLDMAETADVLAGAVEFLRRHPRSTGKVGVLGWGFGGGWALNASLVTPVDATVVFYGFVRKSAAELKALNGPVLGHFGTLDKSLNGGIVPRFEAAMREAGKGDRLTIYWYDADHAFANPAASRYDSDDAKLAWERTLFFLRKYLG